MKLGRNLCVDKTGFLRPGYKLRLLKAVTSVHRGKVTGLSLVKVCRPNHQPRFFKTLLSKERLNEKSACRAKPMCKVLLAIASKLVHFLPQFFKPRRPFECYCTSRSQ